MKKRLLSILLALSMLPGVIPAQALAAETVPPEVEETQPEAEEDVIAPRFGENESEHGETLAVPPGHMEDTEKPALPENTRASGTYGDNLVWTLENGTLTVSGHGEMPNPRSSSGAPWYSSGSSIVTVVIRDGVTSIGSSAFCDCINLTDVTIPDGITSIGSCAFAHCSSLPGVTIPDGVTSIGGSAFQGCTKLAGITIPDSVTGIGAQAFFDCSGLTSVILPATASIGSGTFSRCTAVSYVKLTGTGEMVYWGSYGEKPWGSNTTTIDIEPGVTSIAAGAFEKCSSLTGVTIPEGVTSIGGGAFRYCHALKNITIPGSVTSIGADAFYHCIALPDVTIPESVTSIGSGAFNGCSALTSVAIPGSVTSMGDTVFMWCSGLKNATVESAGVGDSTFFDCESLESVTILDSVTSIGNHAFKGCSGLESVTIPDSVASIGNGAFEGCSGLKSVTIPDSVTSIGKEAFRECESLSSVTMPREVISIGERTFDGCSGLTSILIRDRVASIGAYAFLGCTGLTDVYYTGSEEQWKAIIGCGNNLPKSAAIHYNSPEPEPEFPEAKRTVVYAENVGLDETGQAYVLDGGSAFSQFYITDRTLLKGVSAAGDLRHQNVLVEYDAASKEALRITLLETKTGVVSAFTREENGYTVVIDGVSCLWHSSSYQNGALYLDEKVQYCLAGQEIMGNIQVLFYRTGTLESWDGREAAVDGQRYVVRTNTVPAMPDTGAAVGLWAISSNYLPVIVELSECSYETKTGTLTGYDRQTRTAEISGQTYPVNLSQCKKDLAAFTGRDVFFLLANGGIVDMDALENAAYGLKLSFVGVASNLLPSITYKDGAFEQDKVTRDYSLKLSNQPLYVYPELYSRFYDRDVIDAACIKTPITLDSAVWKDCKGLRFTGPALDGVTLQPGETVTRKGTVTVTSDPPVQKTERLEGQLSVNWRRAGQGDALRTSREFAISVKNEDYTLNRPPQQKPATADAAVAAKRAYRELSKLSALSLAPDTMKDIFELEGSALHRFERELQAVIAMSSVPKETLRDKVEDKVLTEIFGKYKPSLSAQNDTISVGYAFRTARYGRVTASFHCQVLDVGLNQSSFGKLGTISYEIVSSERGSISQKSGLLGGSASADVSGFVSAATAVVEEELKGAFDTGWGNSANEVAELLFSTTVKRILKSHNTSVKDITWDLLVWPSKNVKVKCPVDVFVYDQDGSLCGAIENNTVTRSSGAFGLSVEGGAKYITGLEDGYRLEYKATDSGYMSVEIEEFASAGTSLRQILHYDVPLDANITYAQSIPAQVQQPEASYALHSSTGEVIPAEEIFDTPADVTEEAGVPEPLEIIGWTVTDAGSTLIELVDRTELLSGSTLICAAKYDETGRMESFATGAFEGDTAAFAQTLSEDWAIYVLNSGYCPLTSKAPLSPALRYSLH